jgi:hypothetical protein
MGEVMNAYAIMHNIIIESECVVMEVDDMTYEHQGLFLKLIMQMLADFGAFICIHQEIRDE